MSIVTDGLVGYWHYQQGVSGSTWENIAPATKGQHNGQIDGAVLQSDGMYFDGVDDGIHIPNVPQVESYTLDMIFKRDKDVLGAIGEGYSLSENIHVLLRLNRESTKALIYSLGSPNIAGTSLYTVNNFQANLNELVYLNVTFERNNDGYIVKTYRNGSFLTEFTASKRDEGLGTDFYFGKVDSGNVPFGGYFKSYRIYNKVLTDAEVQQNYQNGVVVGLDEEPPPQEAPKPTVLNISRNTISDEPNMDRATVTFTFDQDVTEWKVNVLGSSHDTGTIADSGGAVTQGTEITAEIDYTELYQEGQNRINIYGKNGEWTPYE
jgi:hypothetical protein